MLTKAVVVLSFLFTAHAAGLPGEGPPAGWLVLRSPLRQGGTLIVGASRTLRPMDSVFHEDVRLLQYAGDELRALQFLVLAQHPLRIRGISRGSDLADTTLWQVRHVIRPGKSSRGANPVDTALVLFYADRLEGLTEGSYGSLVRVTFAVERGEGILGESASVSLRDVVGGLPTGENAMILPGAATRYAIRIPP